METESRVEDVKANKPENQRQYHHEVLSGKVVLLLHANYEAVLEKSRKRIRCFERSKR